MSHTEVTRQGQHGSRPGRQAVPGSSKSRRWGKHRGAEQPMVPRAEFTSYYGKPVINAPVWEPRDVAGYLFLGGLAGASSLLGAGAQLTRRPSLERVAKAGAFGAGCLSMAALVHDLGRPARFLHMLRVFKVSSPMSVGSWLLAWYVPAAGVAAASALTGRVPRVGAAGTAGAAALGPAVAAYTAVLISDTAIPAWHDGHPELPFVFAGSAATAAAGLGLLAASPDQNAPAGNLGLFGACLELTAARRMMSRIGMLAEPYHKGRAGGYVKAGEALTILGAAGSLASRNRFVGALSGVALLAASAATRLGIFHAGLASARDPKYTVVPQRGRLRRCDDPSIGPS